MVQSARSKAILSAILFAVIMAVATLLRNDMSNPRSPDWFWRMKLAWTEEADIALIGNSRVYRGLDPAAFQRACAGAEARNFGFSGTIATGRYLERAQSLLRPDGLRVIVVGFTPNLFKGDAERQDGFTSAQDSKRIEKLPWWLLKALSPVTALFEPLEQPWSKSGHYIQDFRQNGFVASDFDVPKPEAMRTEKYLDEWRSTHYSAKTFKEFTSYLTRWTASGIRVFVVQIPSTPRIQAVDYAQMSMSEEEIAAKLKQTGVHYLGWPPVATESYDGSHLRVESAERVSAWVASQVASDLGPAGCAK
jgi:hypothetical protein